MKRATVTPAHTALVSILGGIIAACGLLLPYPLFHHRNGWTILAQLAITCALILLGLVICQRANLNLTQGIIDDRWNRHDVQRLRSLLNSRWSNALLFALFLAYLILSFSWFSSPHHHSITNWAIYILMMSFLWLRASVRQPSTDIPHPTWNNLSPLHSEHWGQH
ncbi:MAG: hypothetical protein WBY53_05695 [Acidobacteriaceae bacterium]